MGEKEKELSESEKFKIVKAEAIKDFIEQWKNYARYIKKPVKKMIDGKIIIFFPNGKIFKNVSLDDFLND